MKIIKIKSKDLISLLRNGEVENNFNVGNEEMINENIERYNEDFEDIKIILED